jgi:mono/diheme cytochrome c family protein
MRTQNHGRILSIGIVGLGLALFVLWSGAGCQSGAGGGNANANTAGNQNQNANTSGNQNENANTGGNENANTPGLDGASLYATNCAACHGADGSGGSASNVIGDDAAEITAALNIPAMSGISLSEAEISAIADFLAQ